MLQVLKLAAVGAPTLLSLGSAVGADNLPSPDFTQGDAERGQQVYQRVGGCVTCHGWAGDGQSGRSPVAHAAAANLRETRLDPQGLYDTIRCGIPGTQMPYHDGAAYRDDRCFGMVMSDFAPGQQPVRGKTFRERQMVDLIAYLQKYVIGHGRPTLDECVQYFGKSADKACAYLKDN